MIIVGYTVTWLQWCSQKEINHNIYEWFLQANHYFLRKEVHDKVNYKFNHQFWSRAWQNLEVEEEE